jgi:hypothetical protein
MIPAARDNVRPGTSISPGCDSLGWHADRVTGDDAAQAADRTDVRDAL